MVSVDPGRAAGSPAFSVVIRLHRPKNSMKFIDAIAENVVLAGLLSALAAIVLLLAFGSGTNAPSVADVALQDQVDSSTTSDRDGLRALLRTFGEEPNSGDSMDEDRIGQLNAIDPFAGAMYYRSQLDKFLTCQLSAKMQSQTLPSTYHQLGIAAKPLIENPSTTGPDPCSILREMQKLIEPVLDEIIATGEMSENGYVFSDVGISDDDVFPSDGLQIGIFPDLPSCRRFEEIYRKWGARTRECQIWQRGHGSMAPAEQTVDGALARLR